MSEITYTYTLKETNKITMPPLENVIQEVYLMMKASLGDAQEEIGIMTILPIPKSIKTFIAEPTDEQIVEWALATIDDDIMVLYKENLNSQLN